MKVKGYLAIGLAVVVLSLAAAPPALAEDGRHRSFLLGAGAGAGAGILGTVLVQSLFGSHAQATTPAAAAYAAPPAYYAPPPVVYYPAPAYYVVPPPPPRVYYYYAPGW